MSFRTKERSSAVSKIVVEDTILLLLATLSGPLLWWLSSQWLSYQQPQTDMRQVESLIGLACAVIGVGLCIYWLMGWLAGALMFIGYLTGHRVLLNLSQRFTPAVLRRVIAGLLGIQLLTAPAAMATSDVPDTETALSVTAWMPATGHDVQQPPTDTPTRSQSLVTQAPAQSLQKQQAESAGGAWMPKLPPLATKVGAQTPREDATEFAHTVISGDSLWRIAATELGHGASNEEIDIRWRQWWQHNREIIGSNPHQLQPGTVLEAPVWD